MPSSPGPSAVTVAAVSEGLQRLLDRHVAGGTAPGVVAVLGQGEDAEVITAGVGALGGAPMTGGAIMRIQSMTRS